MSSVISPLDVKQMQLMREQGYSIKFIAEFLGFENSTVQKYTCKCKENSIPELSEEEVRKIIQMHESGINLTKIVSETGRTKHAVRFVLGTENWDEIRFSKDLKPQQANQKKSAAKAPSRVLERRTKSGYRVIPSGYTGLRTPTHPDGRW